MGESGQAYVVFIGINGLDGLSHEMAHARHWAEIRNLLIEKGETAERAGMLAFAFLQSPEGTYLSEIRAQCCQGRYLRENPNDSVTHFQRDMSLNLPVRMNYPLVQAIHRVAQEYPVNSSQIGWQPSLSEREILLQQMPAFISLLFLHIELTLRYRQVLADREAVLAEKNLDGTGRIGYFRDLARTARELPTDLRSFLGVSSENDLGRFRPAVAALYAERLPIILSRLIQRAFANRNVPN